MYDSTDDYDKNLYLDDDCNWAFAKQDGVLYTLVYYTPKLFCKTPEDAKAGMPIELPIGEHAWYSFSLDPRVLAVEVCDPAFFRCCGLVSCRRVRPQLCPPP